MTSADFNAALRMTEGVRWYEWSGVTINGKRIKAQSRGMVRSPMHALAVSGQTVLAAGK